MEKKNSIYFEIILNRWMVFYFFVQNLSEWHFSNRKEYNTIWKTELGEFSETEKDALSRFKEIHQKYTFGREYLGKYFFTQEEPWSQFPDDFSKEETKTLREIFVTFNDKFNAFYQQEEPLLKEWQRVLEQKINETTVSEEITQNLSSFYRMNIESEAVQVFLLPSLEKHTGGTVRLIRERVISLEVSRYTLTEHAEPIGIIWHETTHLLFEKEFFVPLLTEVCGGDRESFNLVKEATASSLFPQGALGKLILGTKNINLHTKISDEYSKQISELANEYISEKKSVDKKFIEKILEISSELKGKLR